MPTGEKVDAVSDLSQKMTSAGSIFLADYSGIDVASVTELRRSLRKAGIEYYVVKNRLAKLAAADSGLEVLSEHFAGPTAMAFAGEDPVEPAKLLQKFIDDGGKLSIKTGLVDGQVLSPEVVGELAKLPSRDELIGKLVGTVNAPLDGLATVLNGLLRNLVGVLDAIKKEKSGGADAAGE